MEEHQWGVDPAVWRKDWGVHIQPVGDGAAAVKMPTGFRHPASRANRLRVQMHSGARVELGAAPPPPPRAPAPVPCCPSCQKPMFLIDIVPPLHRQRGPP